MRGGDIQSDPSGSASPATFARRGKVASREVLLEEFDRNTLKPVLINLRTPYTEEGWNLFGVLLVVFGLIVLFLAIWWAADRLLLFEVEEQIKKPIRFTLRT
jgi:hypothetical protein